LANPAAEHDVTDDSEGCHLGHRTYRTNAERIALRIPKRIAAPDCEDPNAGVDSVSWHNAEHIAAGPNLTQHLARPAILGADYPHLAA
jgi:hypothetical protein